MSTIAAVPVRAAGRKAAPPILPHGREARSARLPADVLDRAVDGERFRLDLPDSDEAVGDIALIRRDTNGVYLIQGTLSAPRAGRYFFQRASFEGVAGELVGHILFDGSPVGWKVEPLGAGGAPLLVETHEDRIVCVNYAAAPAAAPEEAPQTHPTNIPIPPYQTITPLQSMPGATGVIYLDFDGEAGPFAGWGNFDAAASTANNSQIFEVWKRVVEDFEGFNLNITTDRGVFDAAPQGRRQHVVVSPTNIAAPTAGGVAYIGSYNWPGDTVCWAFYSSGKTSAEVISHEVGHALSLSHDGRTTPNEGYYAGHGDGMVGWAPIMGVGYYENLTQWSQGEYHNANNFEDDLTTIVSNNDVDYRADDAGETLATARHLEIAANDSVSGEGIIGSTGDMDAFRFVTTGGGVTLGLTPASSGANLDIHAELVEAITGTIVATSNPDTALTASISETLAAGEYVLKIRGTGRGDPELDGYTDYGSLGTYLISGNVAGGVKPERFAIAENAAEGIPVGTVLPREDHGLSPLMWSISSGGNHDGAFTVNPLTGEIFLVSVPDFEALSSRWDDPADLELFITITDTLNAALTETIRVVVTVTDLNEPPVMPDASLTMLEHTRLGTKLSILAAYDPDHFQFPSFSIVGGNDDGWFEIDPGTGELRVAGDIELSADVTVPLTVQVTDQGAPALSSTATVMVTVIDIAEGYNPGGVMRTYYEGISGSSVSNLTANARFPNRPDSEELLEDFDGRAHGDSFGSTLRGYVIPPVSGSYRFWIAADDASQLRLSTNANPANASTIAYVSLSTDPYSWPDSGTQWSSPVTLIAGQAYYLEARHKDGAGEDHVSVAWSGPGIPKQLLRGLYVAPHEQNYEPEISSASFPLHQDAFAGQEIGTVSVTDVNEEDSHGGFTIVAGNEAGIFAIDPVTGTLRVAVANLLDAWEQPIHILTVAVTDDGEPQQTGTGTIVIAVLSPGEFASTNLFQQVWTGLAGGNLTFLTGNLNYPYRPTYVRTLSGFDAGTNLADAYGSRIRAVVTAPVTGSYTFYLSSDDDSRLLLGSGPEAAGATEIASVTGHTNPGEWTKFPSQSSESVELIEGQSYYIEALHKENSGADHLQVGWTGPGMTTISIIPASALEPYDLNEAPVFAGVPPSFSVPEGTPVGTVVGSIAATDPEGDVPLYAITASTAPGAFAIDADSGVITVADSVAMGPGVKIVTVSAQDRGIGGVYPLKVGDMAVEITVISNNQPPSFVADSILMAGTEDLAFSGSLTASDPDVGDALTFTLVDGPEWLVVGPDGSLGGTPGNDDVGVNDFIVRVADPEGLSDDASLTITVANTNDPPAFVAPMLAADPATEDLPYLATLASFASDPDADDSLVFSMVTGPAWLEVAPDGTLSGTPTNGDTGENVLVVLVTDLEEASAEATVTLFVQNTNDPPVIGELSVPPATQDEAYIASVAAFASDPDAGDSLTFSKVSGPEWLLIGADGSLTGTPANADVGTHPFVVGVVDGSGVVAEASSSITVENVNDAPVFTIDPIVAPHGTEEIAYAAFSIFGNAFDPDVGETPTYSLVDGPPWLAVAPDGSVSGTPPEGSSGTHHCIVRATDSGGLFDEAALVIDIIAALPLPWEEQTIGNGLAGSSGAAGELLTVSGSGSLTGRSDGLHFVWQPLSGDGVITARLDSMQDTGAHALAGVMIRDTLASNSRHLFMGMTGDGGYRWLRRTGMNGNTSTSTSGSGLRPEAWLRLARSGNTITAFKSADGVAWTTVGSLTAALPATCYFGLAVASGSTGVENTAVFGNVSVTP
ncbi:cadherin domain-containing protein [Luteolibacter arcticus]|uniref:Cadherin domain-containing protein n=1 Tax=Luteolibacter arcticus TaxID=1581411 RepID=A0ABT3GCR6_9BACT|nr:cadherin domain-containing protein [Luteolibacter arcticus]MCW1921048.1 cadherin domain-containing protein [Luteolibacter arcticus]